MQTFTTRRTLFGDLCNNSASGTLLIADRLMNMAEKRIIASRDWDFLWRQYTKLTVPSQQGYQMPAYTRKPQNVYVTVGSYRYSPIEVTNREDWDTLNDVAVYSDITTHYFVYDGQIQLYPIPSSASNVITFNARRVAKDLSIADTTGLATITTIATSGVTTTITQSGTTWADGMIGQYIKVTPTNATKGGDGFWYEIATVPSSSTLTLTKTYQGTALATATASYVIGEVSIIPEPHDMLPIFEALKLYYTSVDPNTQKAEEYGKYFIEGYDNMVRDYGSKINVVVDEGDYMEIMNPNLRITL
jgi:hypothetical protein